MISPDKKAQPWTSFWKEKDESNKRFLAAAAVGNISEVRRLLNPLSSVEQQPDVRCTNHKGYGAVHLAVLNNHLEVLKTILQTDRTLLCMETESDSDSSTIIHLAVLSNNLSIVRFLLNTQAYFRLEEEGIDKKAAKQNNSSSRRTNILTLENAQGNTAIHLMYKKQRAGILKVTLKAAH